MISTRLHNAINAQINAELWSAYLYLAMSLDAESKGYKGVANWFFIQFKEEQDHARIFMNYLNSVDAKVELLPIAEVKTSWDSVLEMFKQSSLFTHDARHIFQRKLRTKRSMSHTLRIGKETILTLSTHSRSQHNRAIEE